MSARKIVWGIALVSLIGTDLSALAGPGAAGHGHGAADETAYGQPGDPKARSRPVTVTMREIDGKMVFIPNVIEVKKGEQVRFMMRNSGLLHHEMVLATLEENLKHAIEMQKNPDMEHDDPNAKRLAPEKSGEIIWRFTKAGEFDFSCLIPGHREAGMTGKVIVK